MPAITPPATMLRASTAIAAGKMCRVRFMTLLLCGACLEVACGDAPRIVLLNARLPARYKPLSGQPTYHCPPGRDRSIWLENARVSRGRHWGRPTLRNHWPPRLPLVGQNRVAGAGRMRRSLVPGRRTWLARPCLTLETTTPCPTPGPHAIRL